MKKLLHLSLIDFKLIFRDPSLRIFLVLPFVLFALVIWVLPGLVNTYPLLRPYLPVFLMIALIENTQMFCFISSMVLIDEKETQVAAVYGIVPLSRIYYLVSRLLIPFLFTAMLNELLLLVQPFYPVGLAAGILLSLLTALVVPVYVLGINAIVKNRMQGMVYIKAFNMLVLLPLLAFFVPKDISPLFGLLPTHWIFQSTAALTRQASLLLPASIGFVFLGALLWLTARLFIRKHFL